MSRKSGVILSYVLMVLEVLSTLLLTPFIIRTLGQAEYGVYKLVASINAYLLLLDLGIGNAIIRYVAMYRVEENKLKERQFVGVATLFYLGVAALAIILGCILILLFPTVFANGLSKSQIKLGQLLLFVTMLNSAVTLGSAAYNNILIAYEKFAVSRVASIVQIIIRIILTYVALLLGWGSVGIVLVNLIMTVIIRAFFVCYVFWSLKLRPKFKGIQLTFVKEIVKYSSLVLLQMIATQINSSVDQILIGSLVQASAVILAVYGVGTQIVQYFQSIGSSFTGVLMPGIVKLVEKKASPSDLTNEMIRVGRLVFMALSLIWCGFLVFGREFILLWAGADNSDAYFVASILMFAYIFTLTESIGSQILWAINEHKEQAVLKIVIVLLNILLTILLIQWSPLFGATIGTFISLILGDVVVMNVIFKKKLKLNLLDYYKGLFNGIISCLFIATIVAVLVQWCMPQGWIWLCIKIVIIVTVYAITMLKFGMTPYEKCLCKSLIIKIFLPGGLRNDRIH